MDNSINNKDRGMSIYEIKRLPRMISIDPRSIALPKYRLDDYFVNLYTDHLKGKFNAALTRFSIDRIVPGSYEKDGNGILQHKITALDPNSIELLINTISAGHRPEIHIYKHQDSKSDSFLCSDDENAYEAYRQLGIIKVPVVLLDYDHSYLEESALAVKIRLTPKGPKYYLDKLVPNSFSSIPTFFGLDSTEDFTSSMSFLIEEAYEIGKKLRAFHLKEYLELHYHHTIASILHKIIQSINAIRILSTEKLFDQAYIQIRALYELSLNFYIDWLAPEMSGPYLQFFDASSKERWTEFKNNNYKKIARESSNPELIKLQKSSDNKWGNLLGRVSEKASLNPLNSKHSELYKLLSEFAHQDFRTTAKYIDLLENAGCGEDISGSLNKIRLFTDLIVAQVLTNISSDIGEPNQTVVWTQKAAPHT